MPPTTAALVAVPKVLQLGVSHVDALRAPAHGESPAHQAPAQPTVRSPNAWMGSGALQENSRAALLETSAVTAFDLQKWHCTWVFQVQSKFQL